MPLMKSRLPDANHITTLSPSLNCLRRLVQAELPAPSSPSAATIQAVIRELHSRGTTSYTEPGLGPGTLFGGLHTDNADPRLLRAIGVKIFGDGVPPNRTAWMNEPYPEGGHGALCVHGDTPALQADGLREMIRVAHEAGFQLGVHVTGDRAIDTVVDAFVAADTAAPRPDACHYVIHGGFISAGSLAKLAAHGYGVNMNPAIKWTISDLMDKVVGPDCSAYQWPVRSALDAGVRVCASSDTPITEPDWRQGVAAMMLRESKASGPDQWLPLADALRAYTATAAWQDFADDFKGTVEPGRAADLCVLDRPLLGLDPHEITEAQVDLTVFDGRVVFGR
jgi:predicted amidohydrolase YtcJ